MLLGAFNLLYIEAKLKCSCRNSACTQKFYVDRFVKRMFFSITFPRNGCFESFGQYSGDELENEPRSSEESAKACQARCAATKGCSFFSFKEVRAGCHMSSRAAKLTYAKGLVGGSVACRPGGPILPNKDYFPQMKNHW